VDSIDCGAIAQRIEDEAKSSIAELKEKHGRQPRLAVISFGNAEQLIGACENSGIETAVQYYANDANEKEIINYIRVLNADKGTDAIAVFGQAPKGVAEAVNSRKDANRAAVPLAVMAILESGGLPLEGKHIVIINRSRRVGLPLAQMLLRKDATVTVCHTKTFDLSWHTGQADILISAAGKPGLINGGMIKKGAIIVDAGMAQNGSGLAGDADDSIKEFASLATTIPGGVDAVAAAMMLKNTAAIFAAAYI